jgi:hypothetical protein
MEIENKIEQLAKIIDAPFSQMVTFGNSRDDGTPNIEVNDSDYFYVIRDRMICENRRAQNFDELLYWVFSGICFSMSCKYELENRKPQMDTRRIMFQYQLELLNKINTEWCWKRKREIGKILDSTPYDDN